MHKQSLSFETHRPSVDLIYDVPNFDPDFPVLFSTNDIHIPESGPITYLHYHDVFEIGYCYKGSGIFIVGDKIMPFSKGNASIVFRNEIHIANSNPEQLSSWRFVYVDPILFLRDLEPGLTSQILTCLDGHTDFMNIIEQENDSGLISLIMEIIQECRNKKHMYQITVKGLIISLLARLTRVVPASDSYKSASRRNGMVGLLPALDYIYQKYCDQINIPELAALCNMSVATFRRRFKKVMEITPYGYIINIRIRMASVLLTSTDLLILEVSQLSGFQSLSSFNRYFNRIMGVSPREWRKNL